MFLEDLSQDLLHAFRAMRPKPGFTAAALLTLALGIGANTAVFSIVDAVLLQPLPYLDSTRLVAIWDRNLRERGVSKMFDSFSDFEQVARQARTLDHVAAATWAVGGRLLSSHGPTREVLAMPVSASFFPLLGVPPARGRTFLPDDTRRGCSVVLGDHLWRGPLSADPALVGNTLTLDDQPCTVLGIMPPGFAFYPEAAQLWILLTPHFDPPPDQLPVGIFARLKPGVTIAQAQAEISALHTALHRGDTRERDLEPVVYNLREEFTFLAEAELRTTLWVLLAAVGFVLLMTCLNGANLLLGQAIGRERELAIRAALGCARTRLLRQLLTEAVLLASLGATLGLALAGGALRLFHTLNPIELPVGVRIGLNFPVLAFTALVTILTALLFGLLPAWKASRLNTVTALRAAGRSSVFGRHRLSRLLVAGEMALSLVLLAGAGLLMRSVLHMGSEPLGFRTHGLLVTALTLPARYDSAASRRLQFYDRLATALGPQAAFSSSLPPYGPGARTSLRVLGQPHSPESPDAGRQTISPEYFDVLGVHLLRGRPFAWRDRLSSEPVAIINEALAREYFPQTDPIGQRITLGDPDPQNPWLTIIGVAANDKRSSSYHQIGWLEQAIVFRPLAQDPPRSISIAIHGIASDPRRTVATLDPAVAVGDPETIETRLGRMLAWPRFRAALLVAFACFAILLAAIGLYGVLRQFVERRRQEIGIRMALGATPAAILRLIVRQGGAPVFAGLAAGWFGTAALSRYLTSLLYGVEPGDPATFAIVIFTLLTVAAISAILPARRATRVDPMVTLRND